MCCFLPMRKNFTLPTCMNLLLHCIRIFSSAMPKKQQLTGIILQCHMLIDLMKDWLNIPCKKRHYSLKKKKKKASPRSIQAVLNITYTTKGVTPQLFIWTYEQYPLIATGSCCFSVLKETPKPTLHNQPRLPLMSGRRQKSSWTPGGEETIISWP